MRIILFFLSFSILLSLSAQVAPKQKMKQIFLEYKSTTKTIKINDTLLTITERKDTFDNPVSSIPSKSTLEDRDYTLSKKEIYDLTKFIQDNKFFDLEDSYGAPEKERNYPTSILIQMHKKEKTVVYRSNPSFSDAPDSFKKIESYILKLRK